MNTERVHFSQPLYCDAGSFDGHWRVDVTGSVYMTTDELQQFADNGYRFNVSLPGKVEVTHGTKPPAGMHVHDHYAPHSHEVRVDHRGVPSSHVFEPEKDSGVLGDMSDDEVGDFRGDDA